MTGHFEKGAWIKDKQPEDGSKCIGEYHVKITVGRSEFDTLLDDMKEFEKPLFLEWAQKQKQPFDSFMRYGKWIIAAFGAFCIAYLIYAID